MIGLSKEIKSFYKYVLSNGFNSFREYMRTTTEKEKITMFRNWKVENNNNKK